MRKILLTIASVVALAAALTGVAYTHVNAAPKPVHFAVTSMATMHGCTTLMPIGPNHSYICTSVTPHKAATGVISAKVPLGDGPQGIIGGGGGSDMGWSCSYQGTVALYTTWIDVNGYTQWDKICLAGTNDYGGSGNYFLGDFYTNQGEGYGGTWRYLPQYIDNAMSGDNGYVSTYANGGGLQVWFTARQGWTQLPTWLLGDWQFCHLN